MIKNANVEVGIYAVLFTKMIEKYQETQKVLTKDEIKDIKTIVSKKLFLLKSEEKNVGIVCGVQ